MSMKLGQQQLYKYRRPTGASEWGPGSLSEPEPPNYVTAILPGLARELSELLETARKAERDPAVTKGRYIFKFSSEPELPAIPPPPPTPPKTIAIGRSKPQEHAATHLLGLPPHLRELIYKAIFQDNRIDAAGLEPLLTCRQVYHEAQRPAWEHTVFSLEHHTRAFTQAKLSLCLDLNLCTRRVQALRVNTYHLSTLYRLRGSLPFMDLLHVVDTKQSDEDERTYWGNLPDHGGERVLFQADFRGCAASQCIRGVWVAACAAHEWVALPFAEVWVCGVC